MPFLSSDIAKLGEKFYFDKVQSWYKQLCLILTEHKCEAGPLPDIHSDSGRGFVEFTGKHEGQVFFTWHKMPSGRYEVICYRS